MSRDPYQKSKDLGFDYLKDRYRDDGDWEGLRIELDDVPFEFDAYMKKCAEAFYEFNNSILYQYIKDPTRTYTEDDDGYYKQDCDFYTHCRFVTDGLEPHVCFFDYEPEDRFIERKQREIKEEAARLEKQRKQKLKKEKDDANKVLQLKLQIEKLTKNQKDKLLKELV